MIVASRLLLVLYSKDRKRGGAQQRRQMMDMPCRFACGQAIAAVPPEAAAYLSHAARPSKNYRVFTKKNAPKHRSAALHVSPPESFPGPEAPPVC